MGNTDRRPPMSRARLWRLCRKEWRETLRDRRTILTLILMPILVYPLLSILFQKFLATSAEGQRERVYVIGVETLREKKSLEEWLLVGDELLKQSTRQFSAEDGQPYTLTWPKRAYRRVVITTTNLEEAVAKLEVHLGIRVEPHPQSVRSPLGLVPHTYRFLYRENSTFSEEAIRYVELRLNAVNMMPLLQQQAAQRDRLSFPALMKRQAIKSSAESMISLGSLVPLILILMTITGAVYPAIDLTAGERERGTLETLIAAPTPRLAILFAKYVAVLSVASMTAGINLVAMTVTAMSSGMGSLIFGESGLTFSVIVQVFLLMLLFAGFFSAMLLALTSLARSFKEAQAYTIPLMLVSITPGVISLFPGVELNGWLSVTPLINIVLLSRDVFAGEANLIFSLAAIVSTIFYAIAALGVAANVFGTDAVLYGSSGTWSDLLRRPRENRAYPTISQATFCLALIFPPYFVISSGLGMLSDAAITIRMSLSALAIVALFGGFPLIACWLQRVDLRSGLRVHSFHWLAGLGALVLGCAVWPFAFEMALFGREWLKIEVPQAQMQLAEELAQELKQTSLFVILATLALAPAMFEELFFRGFLFSALRQKYRPGMTIVISGVLFGLFHVLVMNRLAMERLLPTTLMGLVLGMVAYRSGSVVPAMLLHALHNSLMLCLAHYRDRVSALFGWASKEQEHLPVWLLAVALGVCTVGGFLLWLAPRRGREKPPQQW